jgi:dipeptidyl aminopeptidase/acylaminoacyl peptidase
MKKNFLLLLFLFVAFAAFSQKKYPLREVLYYGGITVNKPVVCDTINVKGDKFEQKNLLDAFLNEPATEKYKLLKAGDDSIFLVNKPAKGNQLSLWKFFVMPENFFPLKLEIKSTNAFEVYLDGVKNTEKLTREGRLEKAGSITVSLQADPRQYVVLVKMLSSDTDSCQTNFVAKLLTEKQDSLAHIDFSTSAHRHLYTPDFLTGKRIGNASISPNGKFVLTNYNIIYNDGTKVTSTEVTDIQSGKLLLKDPSNARAFNWLPKTNSLYYTMEGLEGRELHILNPVTQQEKIVAKKLPEGDFSWSPLENFLIFSIPESASENKGELHRLLSPEDRQVGFRSRSSLYCYDFKTGLLTRLTYGKENIYLNDISEDEKELLFSTNVSVVTEAPFYETSLYLLNLETMKVDTIWYHDKNAIDAIFSPDAKQILIKGAPASFDSIGLNIAPGQIANLFDIQAYIMDVATKKTESITKGFDPSIIACDWNKEDGNIYFRVEDKDYVRVYRYEPAKKKFYLLPLSPDVVIDFNLAKTNSRAVYYGSTNTFTGKVYTIDLKTLKENVVADPGSERLGKVDIGKTADWNFKMTDGTTIYGRYYLPPSFDPAKKYPLLVYYYGGTSPTSRSFESNYPLNLYAAMGYVVYTLQPSGTTGFGQEFSARHVNAWGERTADEIILGTKLFCREHTFADSTRMGCFGASYGGFMTMYIQTKTDMFKAAVSHAGISSIASYWGDGYWGYTYSAAASAGSYPWNNSKLYTEHSPLFNADKIKTPILLLQGKMDTNVPLGESIQMYTALKILGKPVELIHVDGENHSIKDYQHKLEWQRTILAWFAKYLKNDSRWWNEMYKPGALDQ